MYYLYSNGKTLYFFDIGRAVEHAEKNNLRIVEEDV